MCEAENDFPECWPLIKLSNVALTGASGLIDPPGRLRHLRNEVGSAIPYPSKRAADSSQKPRIYSEHDVDSWLHTD